MTRAERHVGDVGEVGEVYTAGKVEKYAGMWITDITYITDGVACSATFQITDITD